MAVQIQLVVTTASEPVLSTSSRRNDLCANIDDFGKRGLPSLPTVMATPMERELYPDEQSVMLTANHYQPVLKETRCLSAKCECDESAECERR